MAKLGVKTVDELVGRGDLLKKRDNLSERQSKIDLDCILNNPFDGKSRVLSSILSRYMTLSFQRQRI